ncbi:PREDICTED: histamine H2 receptor-like [Priapulus caudatus]|uniref:Histamine H2 receptor-like n=1 Tax=Priapulus caudatus TaxID=37621 RepID=A0ABM1F9R5_PRICU|nr:PREDICTED: histamine H2 receptor-like [Priapulus caudatus]
MNETRFDNDSNPIGSQEDGEDGNALSNVYFYQTPTFVKVLMVLLFATASAVTLVGNGLVIIVIGKIRRLQIPANLTIVNLALYDFLMGLVAIAVLLPHLTRLRCVFVVVFGSSVLRGGVLGIGLCTINRYVAIVHPLRYNQLMTAKRTCILMGLCLLYALATGIAIGIDVAYSWGPLSTCNIDKEITSGIVAFQITNYIALVIIMTYCYIIIAKIAWDHTVRMAAATAAQREELSTFDAIMKKSKIMLIVVGTSFLFIMPNVIHTLLVHIVEASKLSASGLQILRWIRLLGFIINTWLNPIIYFYKYKDFRQAAKELFGCKPSSIAPFQPSME